MDLKELKTGSGKASENFAIAHSKSGCFLLLNKPFVKLLSW